jgi:stalled ribosome alternative rescue factor ArfA
VPICTGRIRVERRKKAGGELAREMIKIKKGNFAVEYNKLCIVLMVFCY